MKKGKYIAGGVLIAIGAVFAFKGAMEGDQRVINVGIGGIFLGIIVLTFSTSDYIKYDAFKAMVSPYFQLCKGLINSLELKSKAVYIPAYGNLPEGGIFIPLHDNFDLDLAKLDENSFFITDVGREREMGLFLAPLGRDLMKMYEAYTEMDFTNAGLHTVENASVTLKSLGLATSVTVEERGEKIRVLVAGVKTKLCSKKCEQVACPICSSILLSIAKSIQELVVVESFKIEIEHELVEITVRRIGGINKWM
ncbi:MAG: hypothetical protein KAT65_07440 [Methanophagales archaeon]|nr:hypothetical protein [Methanophagales archaeon]